MSRETGIIVLGFFVALLPFLGFPESWRIFFFVIIGIGIAVIGFFMRAHTLGNRPEEERRTFVENNPRRVQDIHPTYERVEEEG